MKQVSKNLPEWITQKQQKEEEEMQALEKSMEEMQESRLVIQSEMAKHQEYMIQLTDKVSLFDICESPLIVLQKKELMKQFEAEAQENSMRKSQINQLQRGKREYSNFMFT